MHLKDNDSIIQTRKTLKEQSKVKQAVYYALCLLGGKLLGLLVLGNIFSDFITMSRFEVKLLRVAFTSIIQKYAERLTLINTFSAIFAALLMYLFAVKYQGRNNRSLGLAGENKFRNYILGAFIGTVMLATVVIANYLTGHISASFNMDNFSFKIFFLFLLGWILQGFSEEFMFRGVLMNWLAAERGFAFAALVSSLLFSLFHCTSPGFTLLVAINLFLDGIFYSLMFYISDDIFLVGAAHSFWNFFQGNIFGVQVSGKMSLVNTILESDMNGETIINGREFGIEGSLIFTIINIGAILICIKIIRDRKLLVKNNTGLK
ncbi:MAG: CPBP family intramembrane glutamic endopeptidase [Finegoldia sp.]|nr:CPBP family intramembrane glutamic endopeptidase [Finegoldia sp.]